MPDFAGEVLIFDNGSSERTLATLRDFISHSSLRIRLVQSEENLGVACGRNRAIAEVNSSWVMSLDNDVFFIKDPRRTIQMELAQIGCKFLSFPLLNADQTYFACGNHLYVALDENKSITVSSGSAFDGREMVAPADPTIGTCLFGTCLFEAGAFRSVGGYDEALFIGFEDVDLSIRLFRLGFKVGCSGFPFLVHDHPTGDADLDYSKIRFSREHIMASARHLEAKYGYSFWNTDLLNWLDSKGKAVDGSMTDAASTDIA
jgi:GT2 family glycosyltransferase